MRRFANGSHLTHLKLTFIWDFTRTLRNNISQGLKFFSLHPSLLYAVCERERFHFPLFLRTEPAKTITYIHPVKCYTDDVPNFTPHNNTRHTFIACVVVSKATSNTLIWWHAVVPNTVHSEHSRLVVNFFHLSHFRRVIRQRNMWVNNTHGVRHPSTCILLTTLFFFSSGMSP